jgi:alpha-ketoglutarate-dependent taurine dioxygenase
MDKREARSVKFAMHKRTPVSLSPATLVQSQPLLPNKDAPLVFRPCVTGVNLLEWAQTAVEDIKASLLNVGALLFRGFESIDIPKFEQLLRIVGGEPLEYVYQSTPRTRVSGNIYTSTEYPPHQRIPFHNEMSYSREWPLKIGFYCVTAPRTGGETPLADSRKVFEQIDPSVRATFERKGVMYLRNYGEGLDLPWQQVFQTEDRATVERYCEKAGITCEWKSGDRLATYQVCKAAATHPLTGAHVWFNQAHLFHISALEEEVQTLLTRAVSEDDLPRNARYGDGSAIDRSTLDHIRGVYDGQHIQFSWQEGDILLLDNMLMAHGRNPFVGPRRIVVGMTQPSSNSDF